MSNTPKAPKAPKAPKDGAANTPEADAAGANVSAPIDPAQFRQKLAAVKPGARAFGSIPAAKMRLEEALAKMISGREAVQAARAILEDLKGETVTGSDVSGAEAILGDELPEFEAVIEEAEEFFKSVAGE
jgi:hypothetical protein